MSLDPIVSIKISINDILCNSFSLYFKKVLYDEFMSGFRRTQFTISPISGVQKSVKGCQSHRHPNCLRLSRSVQFLINCDYLSNCCVQDKIKKLVEDEPCKNKGRLGTEETSSTPEAQDTKVASTFNSDGGIDHERRSDKDKILRRNISFLTNPYPPFSPSPGLRPLSGLGLAIYSLFGSSKSPAPHLYITFL